MEGWRQRQPGFRGEVCRGSRLILMESDTLTLRSGKDEPIETRVDETPEFPEELTIMSEWKYKVERIASVSDSQLETFLKDEGEKGWELVQILETGESPAQIEYKAVFKREKTLD